MTEKEQDVPVKRKVEGVGFIQVIEDVRNSKANDISSAEQSLFTELNKEVEGAGFIEVIEDETQKDDVRVDEITSAQNHQSGPARWSGMFSTAVNILKFSASIAPRHVGIMRMVTDHSIPSLLLPPGVHLQKRVIVTPGCQIHPVTLGEIYLHKETMKLPPKKQSQPLKSKSLMKKEKDISSTEAAAEPNIGEEPPLDLDVYHGTTVLYAHGGAYCLCSSATHRRLLSMLCLKSTARIIAVNYRRPPEHPHSACVLDIMRAYLHLIESGTPPKSIVFAGDSAGGGLCVSALVALRDAGRPLPAGAALMSPWVDLSDFDGGTWGLNNRVDFLPQDLAQLFAKAVIGENGNPKDPSISPAYADLRGLPPLCVEAGASEVLFSQISKFTAQATLAGVEIEFKASPGMVHVFQLFEGMGQPEPGESLHRIANFISRVGVRAIGSPFDITITTPKHRPKPLGKLESKKVVISGGGGGGDEDICERNADDEG